MTNEKLLELAYIIAQNHAPREFERFRQAPENYIKNAFDPVLDAAAVLIMDARAGMDKKAGKSGILSAAKRIIKNAQKSAREALSGAWIDSSGRQCICDGFRAIRLKDALNGLPSSDGVNIDKFFSSKHGDALRLPSVSELKEIITQSKAAGEKIALYDFGDGLPHVNAAFLLDVLQVLPGCVAYAGERALISPIYFKSDNGDGVLCPIRKDK